MNLVHNERIKLTASWLNALAGAAAGAGVIAPLAAAFYGVAKAPVSAAALAIGVIVWLFVGIGLHLAARHVLRNLKP